MKKKYCLGMVLALMVASVGAQEAKPIRIGVIGPYTGGSSPMGVSMLNAVRLATSEINWKGGVLGRQIELVERDDEAKPDKGEAIARDLVGRDKVDAVVGIANTGVGVVALKYFQQAKVPVIVNMAAGAPITEQYAPPQVADSYVFRLAASDSIQTARLVTEAVDKMHFSKFALLGDNTPYGRQGVEHLRTALAKRGIKPVFEGGFDIGQTDMQGIVSQSKTAGAQALLVWGIGPELAAIAKTRAKAGWKVPMLGSWTLSLDNFIANAGPAGDGALMTQTFIAEPITSRRQEFLISYRKQSGQEQIPSAVSAAQGYDSMLLLAAAVRQANSTQGPAVREALENLQGNVFGVICTYEKPFRKDDHEAITPDMIVTGEITNGRVGFAYKDEARAVILGKRATREVANSR